MTITTTFDNQADAQADATNLADYAKLTGWRVDLYNARDSMVLTIERDFSDDETDWGERTIRATYIREWRGSLGPTDRWCRTIETLVWVGLMAYRMAGDQRRAEDFDVQKTIVPNDVTWRDLLGDDPKAVLR